VRVQVMYWPAVGLLMVGPNGHWIKYSYAEPGLALLPDPDGLRIFSSTKCEFLQKVPGTTPHTHDTHVSALDLRWVR
jgi:hypothetical protein